MMIIYQGKMVERFQGLIPKPNLEEILDEYIAMDINLKAQSNEEE